MKEEFKSFSDRFNKNDSSKPESESSIESFEKENGITFPSDYREFLSLHGDIWTPNILDLIVDNELDIPDVQDFWSVEQIKYDRENGWTSLLETDLIPFASDCMGNIFGFRTEDLRDSKSLSQVYFFDHDFDTIEPISDSFTSWITLYLKILN